MQRDITHGTAPDRIPFMKRFFLPVLLPALVTGIDLGSKLLARTLLVPGVHHPVGGNFFGFTLHQNNGIAFGLFAGLSQNITVPLFVLISLAAIIYIIHFYRMLPRNKRLGRTALMLILGGALGNLLDRLLTGKVTDFIDFAAFVPEYKNHWPVFNLGDVFIIVGVIVLFILLLTDREFGKKNPEGS